MYEHRKQPLLPWGAFLIRLAWHGLGFVAMIGGALGIGVLGYHKFEGLSWIDALANASMILGGMGPLNPLQTTAGKLFASAYALFAGLLFVAAMGVLFAPVLHRLLHRFHVESESEDSQKDH